MRSTLFVIIVVFLLGCTAKRDPIDRLVADYSASHGMWQNGMVPNLGLPQTATQEQVITKTLEMHGFTKEQVASRQILQMRQVRIPDDFGSSGLYTAALVQTSVGPEIVLFQHQGPPDGWWSRVVDANQKSFYGK
jgi:hypothetical protein